MKKLIFSFIAGAVIVNSTNAQDLSGDAATACEVILCLSTSMRPAECSAPLAKFFAIKAKRAHETLTKRKNFLKLCPTNTEVVADNTIMNDYKDLLASMGDPRECEASYLNNKVQTIRKSKVRYVRTTASMPNFCKVLANHQYSDIQLPKYTCNGEYYSQYDYNRGYTLTEITKQEYDKLTNSEREIYQETYECGGERMRTCTKVHYYKKASIKKNCWVN